MSLLINENEYDYASLSVKFDGLPLRGGTQSLQGVKSINYGSALDGGSIAGSRSTIIGTTPGVASHTAEMVLYRRDWHEFLDAMGQAGAPSKFGATRFTIEVEYSDRDDKPVMIDRIVKAKIKKVDSDNSEGPDASVVRVTLDPIDIVFSATKSVEHSIYRNTFFQGQVE